MSTNTTSNSKQYFAFKPDNKVVISSNWRKFYPINTIFYSPQFSYPWSIATEEQRNYFLSQTITEDYVPEEIRAKALLLKN